MNYGEFDADGREYRIKRPDTPRPWFNYLFNEQYHAIISQPAAVLAMRGTRNLIGF